MFLWGAETSLLTYLLQIDMVLLAHLSKCVDCVNENWKQEYIIKHILQTEMTA